MNEDVSPIEKMVIFPAPVMFYGCFMGLVCLLTFNIKINQMHVNIQSSHGS